ncbi:autophagy-related protein 16-1-like [Astyanax mexicanus]|uniref:Autophagy-related protein 16-1-like n=1 Tax=Astyanax mexicanus TaxID=7994 RepID=A0A8T2KXK4_ASTMX|nr:autophagy-related protein 16-1-like [Astyanax mexicanus]
MIMEPWKSHVRAKLFQRDCLQREPFSGLFNKVSRLEDMLNLHVSLLEDLERNSSNQNGIKKQVEEEAPPKLCLELREAQHDREELIQKVSDLTSVLYLKEAELQYCHSQVARFRSEAVLLAKGASLLKDDLSEYQYKLECQSKELAALRLEHKNLKEDLAVTRQEREELLERWLEEKKEEAERLNKHNATLERWNRFAGRLKKRHSGGCCRQKCAAATNCPRITQRHSADQPLPDISE